MAFLAFAAPLRLTASSRFTALTRLTSSVQLGLASPHFLTSLRILLILTSSSLRLRFWLAGGARSPSPKTYKYGHVTALWTRSRRVL